MYDVKLVCTLFEVMENEEKLRTPITGVFSFV